MVVAGGLLLLTLAFFPWHKLSEVGILGVADPTLTALQKPNQLQGTLAFLVTVAMVAQVVMTRYSSQKVNPQLVKLQAPAGMAVFALLSWKLASEVSYLSVGAYLGMLFAGALAYGGFVLSREPQTYR